MLSSSRGRSLLSGVLAASLIAVAGHAGAAPARTAAVQVLAGVAARPLAAAVAPPAVPSAAPAIPAVPSAVAPPAVPSAAPAIPSAAPLVSSAGAAATHDGVRDEPSCAVDKRDGFSDADADGVEQIVCSAARELGNGGRYRVRLGRLGSRIILTLVELGAERTHETQVILTDLSEVSVAAPRLVAACSEQKPLAETLTVSNVVGEETRTPKKRAAEVHAWMGMLGAAGPGASGAGAYLAISAGSERWSFVGDLRLAGDAFNKPASVAGAIVTLGAVDIAEEGAFSYASLTGGVRHHLMATDVAPFLGLGLGVDFIGREQLTRGYAGEVHSDLEGRAGLAGYGELGLDVLRTRVVGGAVSLRADMPAFAVVEKRPDPANERQHLRRSTYAPIFAAAFALRF